MKTYTTKNIQSIAFSKTEHNGEPAVQAVITFEDGAVYTKRRLMQGLDYSTALFSMLPHMKGTIEWAFDLQEERQKVSA